MAAQLVASRAVLSSTELDLSGDYLVSNIIFFLSLHLFNHWNYRRVYHLQQIQLMQDNHFSSLFKEYERGNYKASLHEGLSYFFRLENNTHYFTRDCHCKKITFYYIISILKSLPPRSLTNHIHDSVLCFFWNIFNCPKTGIWYTFYITSRYIFS
jgi:hypothetical protein